MTTEREMLEFAVKACGIDVLWHDDDKAFFHVMHRIKGRAFLDLECEWNPLTNSADCAAMCAKLLIDSDWYNDSIRMANPTGDESYISEVWAAFDDHNNDREAAWRYAATQVAAKIGGMK